ncbi:Predicted arabinose efflux permease, MFS family [Cohnella sp. OV330]|uniref:MFS transporter n=1 Tax=Cohnella sp. OV330 TaxID=1855288 RepID=UPI0008ED8162|nr:MFS transporter [Cohnella sp. OV330]SFB49985.1 Predicted arabinose efflux permease, MFS family [Cohnella sp. OV330]
MNTYTQAERRAIHKRTLVIVVIAQLFGGAGLASGITVGALLAQDMTGSDGLAGLSTTLFTLGSALSAFAVGRLTQRLGRRAGLTAGFLAGAVGALGVVAAAAWDSLPLLLLAMLVYGAGTSTNLQARYAGTDLAEPHQRARAVSIAMVTTTFGAVAGPNLVSPMGRLAADWGIPPLAGPFMLAAAAFALAGLVFAILLRPDPFLVARASASDVPAAGEGGGTADAATPERAGSRGIVVGASVMLITQIVMTAIMTMTPLHMKHHGHSLDMVGMTIGAHIAAMFLPSLVTGVLVDKIGRIAISCAGAVTLLCAGLVTAFAPGDSSAWMIFGLVLLGLGWNFGLISGTAVIVDATTLGTRAKTQGTVDVLISLAGAAGGALSGAVVALSSFAALSLAGGALAVLLLPVMLWYRRGGSRPSARSFEA